MTKKEKDHTHRHFEPHGQGLWKCKKCGEILTADEVADLWKVHKGFEQ